MDCTAAAGEMDAPAQHLQSRLASIKSLYWVSVSGVVVVGVCEQQPRVLIKEMLKSMKMSSDLPWVIYTVIHSFHRNLHCVFQNFVCS